MGMAAAMTGTLAACAVFAFATAALVFVSLLHYSQHCFLPGMSEADCSRVINLQILYCAAAAQVYAALAAASFAVATYARNVWRMFAKRDGFTQLFGSESSLQDAELA